MRERAAVAISAQRAVPTAHETLDELFMETSTLDDSELFMETESAACLPEGSGLGKAPCHMRFS